MGRRAQEKRTTQEAAEILVRPIAQETEAALF